MEFQPEQDLLLRREQHFQSTIVAIPLQVPSTGHFKSRANRKYQDYDLKA
jgi:hypothetical protein